MSDRTALILATLVAGALAVDLALGWGGTMFLARRLAGLVEWLAFWR